MKNFLRNLGKKSGISGAILSMALLSGCLDSIDIRDGRVPANLLPYALKWSGEYSGKFEGMPSKLSIRFDGDKPAITTSADLVGPDCASSIGDLRKITFRQDSNGNASAVAKLDFKLDPGKCPTLLEGRAFHVRGKLKSDGSAETLEVSYLLRTEYRPLPDHCSVVCSGPHGGSCSTVCSPGGYEAIGIYATGSFTRSN